MKVAASIVLYKNDRSILQETIDSVLNSNIDIKLILIDNSPTDELLSLVKSNEIIYVHNPSNPGFGAAHNIAIEKSKSIGADYHFVINPDVFFEGDVIEKMVKYAQENPNIGMMMPQILSEDGSIQYLPKLLPSPLSVIMRKIKSPKIYYEDFINDYELRYVDSDIIYSAPILSGCFTLFNVKALKKIGGYDDRFFMYFEDWDLSRRMHKEYKTLYYPKVSVYHGYESGANKSWRLFKIFIKSMLTYFNKWGWFFDEERKIVNKKTLAQFK